MQRNNISFKDDSSVASGTVSGTASSRSSLVLPSKGKMVGNSEGKEQDFTFSATTRAHLSALADDQSQGKEVDSNDYEPLPLESTLGVLGKRQKLEDDARVQDESEDDDKFLGYQRVKRRRV